MNSTKLIFICFPLAGWACGSAANPQQAGSRAMSGGSAQSGSGTPSNASGGATTGGMSGSSAGSSSGASASGAMGGDMDADSSGAGDATLSTDTDGSTTTEGGASIEAGFDGGVNMVPADYKGTSFTTNTIPGFLYAANYDNGGGAVAFCHSATGITPEACTAGITLTDWCCSDCNAQGTGARCDDRSQNRGVCPLYRMDNAGLSHMNLGEIDTYAVAGPTWVPGPNGPTLTGPMVTVGMPVPQHPNMTTEEDTYLSYTVTGEWQKYTVEVLEAGTYSIGAFIGTPPGGKVTFDLGNGVTSGEIALPPSVPSAACKCIEAYHAWTPSANIGTIAIPAAGTYLMTMTLNAGTYNPLYFTFTKM